MIYYIVSMLSATALARRRARVIPNMLGLGLGLGFGFVLKNLDLGGRTIHPRPWPGHGAPPPKPPKTSEKSLFRALEPPGTSPERSGTAQDHLKAPSNNPRAVQDPPVRPPRRLVRPPRRHAVCQGSRSVCPRNNSMCPRNTKFIEILLENHVFLL